MKKGKYRYKGPVYELEDRYSVSFSELHTPSVSLPKLDLEIAVDFDAQADSTTPIPFLTADNVLADQVTWVRDTLELGVTQMELMNEYLDNFISDLRRHRPEIIDRNTMASLSDNQNKSAILSVEDEFYLNKVRHSSSLLGDMMAPAIATAQTRFQNQIADRIQAINDQFSRIR